MSTTLHPRGVNHLAIATCDMKGQLAFWSDVLGCPVRALYWMHGVPDAKHAFVELAGDSYVAFVDHPDNPKDVEYGVTHAGNAGGPVARGATQHIALHVDTLDEVLSMRDRIRSKGVQVLGPIDHGFIQSIYFAGPEALSLEVCCGSDIKAENWIDPEVVELYGITAAELEALKHPKPFERPPVQTRSHLDVPADPRSQGRTRAAAIPPPVWWWRAATRPAGARVGVTNWRSIKFRGCCTSMSSSRCAVRWPCHPRCPNPRSTP